MLFHRTVAINQMFFLCNENICLKNLLKMNYYTVPDWQVMRVFIVKLFYSHFKHFNLTNDSIVKWKKKTIWNRLSVKYVSDTWNNVINVWFLRKILLCFKSGARQKITQITWISQKCVIVMAADLSHTRRAVHRFYLGEEEEKKIEESECDRVRIRHADDPADINYTATHT